MWQRVARMRHMLWRIVEFSKSPTPASGSNDKYDDEEDDTDDNDGSGGEEADTEVREARKEKEATEQNTGDRPCKRATADRSRRRT